MLQKKEDRLVSVLKQYELSRKTVDLFSGFAIWGSALFLVFISIAFTVQAPSELPEIQIPIQETVEEPTPIFVIQDAPDDTLKYLPMPILYDVPLSDDLQIYAQNICMGMGVHFPLVLAIMMQESQFTTDVISPTFDWGIMQINKGNHSWLESELGITDWLDPYQNILAGVYLLSLFQHLENDYQRIAMYYNSGPTGAEYYLAQGIYTKYSYDVMEILNGLEVRSYDNDRET